MILTVDSGTSVTKVVLWGPEGPVAVSRVPLETVHPAPGWAEQDAATWWTSVVRACTDLAGRVPAALGSVEVVGCTGARQTFAPVDRSGAPTGPGILWSDRRAGDEVARLAARNGAEHGVRSATGIVVDAASVAAKVAWLTVHRPDTLDRAAWLLTPRDLVVRHLTGAAATDPTMASRSGLYDAAGELVEGLAGPAVRKLPPVVASDRVTGALGAEAAAATRLPPGIPVVIGAGDRACEVLGARASATCPMVSWGTTANVSVPASVRPDALPGIVVSRAADGGWLLEGGVSAAGSLLEWLARLTGRSTAELVRAAETSPPGAGGVVGTPWLDGARAPWWRPSAAVALVGMGPGHGPADLARALVEGVGWEVVRCLEAIADRRPAGPHPDELVLGGSGATTAVWLDVLTGLTGLPVAYQRSGQAASAGAALLAARAAGIDWDLDRADPVERRAEPDPGVVERYRRLRPRADSVTGAVIELEPEPLPDRETAAIPDDDSERGRRARSTGPPDSRTGDSSCA